MIKYFCDGCGKKLSQRWMLTLCVGGHHYGGPIERKEHYCHSKKCKEYVIKKSGLGGIKCIWN